MRIQLKPAYLLHRRPFRDSSELLDIFSLEYGRLGLVARGLSRRRRGGSLAALLQPFRPLLISFSGKGELLTLTGAEVGGALAPLHGEALLSAFYLNELVLRLLQRFEAQPAVFAAYAAALGELSEAVATVNLRRELEPALRRFEFALLEELGYAVDLTRVAQTGEPLRKEAQYNLVPELGLREVAGGREGAQGSYRGEDLIAIASGHFAVEGSSALAAKRLVRALLHPHLGAAPLRSRGIFEQTRTAPPGTDPDVRASSL
jgi:DNA repair protein RecO (recombination protein O)